MPVNKIKIYASSYCTADKAQKFSKCAVFVSIILLLVLGFWDYEELGALLSTQLITDLPLVMNPLPEISIETHPLTDLPLVTNPLPEIPFEMDLGPVITNTYWEYWPGHARNIRVMGENRQSLKQQIKKATDHGCMKGWNHRNRMIWMQMGDFPKRKGDIIVWYQLEQEGSEYTRIKEFHAAMQQADVVWDFSKANIRWFGKKHGVTPSWEGGKYFYVPMWNTIPEKYFRSPPSLKSVKKKYDVLLFGSLNDRRKKICEEMKRRKFAIYCDKTWGKDLEQKKRSSRLLLNVHYYPNGSLEVHRLDSVLAAGMVVVSEQSSDTELDREYSPVVTFNHYDNLIETVIKKLEQPESELILEREANFKFMKDVYERVDPDLCRALSHIVKLADKKFPKGLI